MDGAGLFSVVPSDRTGGNGHKLGHQKFQTNFRKNFRTAAAGRAAAHRGGRAGVQRRGGAGGGGEAVAAARDGTGPGPLLAAAQGSHSVTSSRRDSSEGRDEQAHARAPLFFTPLPAPARAPAPGPRLKGDAHGWTVLLARMDYAKSLSLRLAAPVSKCVSASASMTQQLLSSPAPRPRPFRVCNWDRSLRKGIMAQSLGDLLRQAQSALLAPGPISLVLDEDGTAVETEAFFRTLEEGTVLMALSKGQTWAASKTSGYQLSLSRKPPRRIDVACVTFDLYKTNPRDLGCLNVKATLYGTYSMSYDLRCYGAKRLMKEALRWTLFTMQATGHVLLGTSCYMQQLLDATEEPKEAESSPPLQNLLPRSLPPPPRRKTLQ